MSAGAVRRARTGRPPLTGREPSAGERARMTGWYDPGQLLRTALDVVVSTAFARNADRRILDAVEHRGEPDVCDYSAADELWIDYVSDTGDGWNSTYAVAYHAAQPALAVRDPGGAEHQTTRGRLLVFGGDEVYPVASRDAYEQKLVAPYRTALPCSRAPHPALFAVPGNHDWYDSLVSFTRLFCAGGDPATGEPRRWFGGWAPRQRQSYFACKLPRGWWLLGADFQLESDIDAPQLEYFRAVAARMADGDRIVLCLPEPHWIYEARYSRFDPRITQRNLAHLEREVFTRQRIEVWLAGDLHHYRRHERRSDGRQKITAGGGGAFSHPTHADLDDVRQIAEDDADAGRYELREAACFPPVGASRALAWRNLQFVRLNPWFGTATGALYLLLAWAVQPRVAALPHDPAGLLAASLAGMLGSQVAVVWAALLAAGFWFFTDTHDARFRRWGGLAHAAAHLLAAFAVAWGATYVTAGPGELLYRATGRGWLLFGHVPQLLLAAVLIFAGGYAAGATIVGLYLLVALNRFGRHSNEAFSSLHCEDWKSWLRLRVTTAGELVIYPIGIERVPRAWREVPAHDVAEQSLVEPADPLATPPRLIEAPFRCGGPTAPPPVAADYSYPFAPGVAVRAERRP